MKLKIALIFLLLGFVFWPAFLWMNDRFKAAESFYAHGYLIPFISGFLIFREQEKLRSVTYQQQNQGFILLIAALAIHIIATYLEINFISGLCFIAVLFGLVIYNFGFQVLRQVLFPLSFLLFMIPMPQVLTMGVSFYLKLAAARVAAFFIGFIIPLKSAGSIVYLPNGVLTVGSPCSGLKSLIALSALSLLFAHLTGFNLRKKISFFILALPVAFVSNVLRIMLLIFVFHVYGSDIAMGWFHDFSGMLVFVFAFFGLVILRKVFLLWPKNSTP